MTAPLTDPEIDMINAGHCPDCKHRGFVLGPRGGAAINVECGGCANRFNIACTSFSHTIVYGHRLPSLNQGGASWHQPSGAVCERCGKPLSSAIVVDARGIVCLACDSAPNG